MIYYKYLLVKKNLSICVYDNSKSTTIYRAMFLILDKKYSKFEAFIFIDKSFFIFVPLTLTKTTTTMESQQICRVLLYILNKTNITLSADKFPVCTELSLYVKLSCNYF